MSESIQQNADVATADAPSPQPLLPMAAAGCGPMRDADPDEYATA